MKTVIIDDIAFDPEVEGLKRGLHIEEGSEDERDFDRMLAEARSLARPKTIFGQAFVEPAGPDRVVVDGVEFKSRVLRVNLEGRRRSVVFAASSGMEMETWAASYASDDLMSYWADTVCEAALRCARERFGRTMKETMGFEKFSTMNPGSLEDWPVSQTDTPVLPARGHEGGHRARTHGQSPDDSQKIRVGDTVSRGGELRELPTLSPRGLSQSPPALRSRLVGEKVRQGRVIGEPLRDADAFREGHVPRQSSIHVTDRSLCSSHP